jgi:hypothetical protein
MERYADAYDEDPLLHGGLFTDLGLVEKWNEEQSDSNLPGLTL